MHKIYPLIFVHVSFLFRSCFVRSWNFQYSKFEAHLRFHVSQVGTCFLFFPAKLMLFVKNLSLFKGIVPSPPPPLGYACMEKYTDGKIKVLTTKNK